MKATRLFILLILVTPGFASAQQARLFEFREFQKAVINGTRSENGDPGTRYWMNSSDYKLEARIDVSENTLTGKGSIVYHNNSPTALKDIHLRLYQDLFKKGTARLIPVLAEDITDGTFIESLKINGISYINDNKPVIDEQVTRFCTDLGILLIDSIPSGGSCIIELEWEFSPPAFPSAIKRMGRYGDNFFLGLWYPQVSVYDDVSGWDDTPHLGSKEFYNDFSNYDVTIHVPDGYLVWATGVCDNRESVLDEKIIEKLNYARSHDSIVPIIAPDDYLRNIIKGNTWHFRAEHVPDFAFAMAKDYLWKGTSIIADKKSGRRVLVDIVYPVDSTRYSKTLVVARNALLWTSVEFPGIPFPYDHATSFYKGTLDGVSMEFPMIANDGIYPEHDVHNAITVHELFHNYSPFFMGCNETRFGWMDEGWTEFLENKFTGDNFSLYQESALQEYEDIAGTLSDYPVITAEAGINFASFRFLYLERPCTALLLLEELMGEDAFKKATKEFMMKWNGKHPWPYDFFNTFSRIAGENLDWFWKACYLDYGYADLRIKSVDNNKIIIERKGSIPVPIRLEVTYDDGTQERIYRNLDIWKTGISEYPVDLESGKNIQKIILGDSLTPDADSSDNVYQK